MLQVSFALLAVGALAISPTGSASAAMVAALAGVDIVLGAPFAPALGAALPLLVFLAAALTLAETVRRAGLAERAAERLAALGGGHALRLYALVCAACTLATFVVSLDGAVVLMVPLLLALTRRHGAPLGPLLLGTVVVANAASVAVPQGNPTNLVVIEHLGLSPAGFLDRMFLPGLAAALTCAIGAALLERRDLTGGYRTPKAGRHPLSRAEQRALGALTTAALAAWAAPLAGLAPWWPFAGAVALATIAQPRPRTAPVVPVRLAVQVISLLVLVGALGLVVPPASGAGVGVLLAVATLVGLSAALTGNLPTSVSVAGLLAASPTAYAASIGLAVGALATPQGSVATLIATDLAGPGAPPVEARRLAPLAMAGVLAATLVLALGQA